MKDKQKTGKIGEQAAVEFLQKHSYQILERNWRYGKAEIDIIAKFDDLLIFVEVKTRQSDRYGKPANFVSRAQQKLIVQAGCRYMAKVGHEWAVRFDVIGVLMDNHDMVVRLNHYQDAFI